jgi:hypothetical protein
MDYEPQRVRGKDPLYPAHAAESWPFNAATASEGEWTKTIDDFKELLGKLAAPAESTADVLARQVPTTHPDHAKHSSTRRTLANVSS